MNALLIALLLAQVPEGGSMITEQTAVSFYGPNAETITNDTDDQIKFCSTGGTYNECVSLDLDSASNVLKWLSGTGATSWLYSSIGLNVAGAMIEEGDGTYSWDHTPSGIATEGTSEFDGMLWADGGATIAGLTLSGDLDMADYDIIDPDMIRATAEASDVAAGDITIKGPNAYARAVTNTGGGPLLLGGGLGVAKATCLTASGDQTVMVFTACDATGCTSTTVTEDTGTGGDWDCAGTNDQCCSAAETYVDGLGLRFATTCVANVLWVDPAATMTHLALTSANGAGAGTAFVVADGAEGPIVVPGGSGIAWAEDYDVLPTRIYRSAPNQTAINADGSLVMSFGPTSATLGMLLNMSSNRIVDADRSLRIGTDYAPTKGGVTGSVSIGKDAGSISLEVEADAHFLTIIGVPKITAPSYLDLHPTFGLRVRQQSDIASADAASFQIDTGTGDEMTATSGTQYGVKIDTKLNQTSTAAYTGIGFDVTDTSSGSGQDYLINLKWATAVKFSVEDDGDTHVGGPGTAFSNVKQATATITFPGGGAATQTAASLIPDGAVIKGFTSRVVTTGTTCAGMHIGTGADDDLFAEDAGITDNDTTDNTDISAALTAHNPTLTATDVVVTGTNGGGVGANCVNLVVDLYVHYIDTTAATADL